MIDARELRIGNWVIAGNKFVEVKSIDETGINMEASGGYYVGEVEMDYDGYFKHNWYQGALIEPIPLTPEILEKCGFTNQGIGYYIEYGNDRFIEVGQQNEVYLSFDGDEYLKEEYEHIENLHQLQNLYQLLSGKELIINQLNPQ